MIKSRLILLIVGLTLVLTACPGPTPPPTKPKVENLSETVAVGSTVEITLKSDLEGVTFAIDASGLERGTATLDGAVVTYTSNAGAGTDSFTYTAAKDGQTSDPATVTITVTDPASGNTPPVANDASETTQEDTAIEITLVATDVDGDELSYEIVSQPENGSLSGDAPIVTYTPNAGFTGTDSFTFKANDGEADSNVATVTINVVAAGTLTVTDDSYKTIVNARLNAGVDRGGLIGAVDVGVRENDVGVTAITEHTDPVNGTLDFNLGTGSFRYTPNIDFIGSDSFTYTATNGTVEATATVTITVAPANPDVEGSKLVVAEASDTLSTVVVGAAEGDVIYLLPGTSYTTPGVVLKANQQLIGAGVALELNDVSLAPAGDKPTIRAPTARAVSLADNTTVKGFVIEDAGTTPPAGVPPLSAVYGTDQLAGTIVLEDLEISNPGRSGIEIAETGPRVPLAENGKQFPQMEIRRVAVKEAPGIGIFVNDASVVIIDNVAVEGVPASTTGIRIESEYDTTVTISNSVVSSAAEGVVGYWIFKNNAYANSANASTLTATLNSNQANLPATDATAVGFRLSRVRSFPNPPEPDDPADNGPLSITGTGNTTTAGPPDGAGTRVDFGSCDPIVSGSIEVNGATLSCVGL